MSSGGRFTMATRLHPGVYVQEAAGARSIEGVPTSIPIFVGETERGPLGATQYDRERGQLAVTKINGRREYARLFGGYRRRRAGRADPDSERLLMPYALDGFFSNAGGNTSAYI